MSNPTFKEFKQSREQVQDLRSRIIDLEDHLDPLPGYLYLDGYYIFIKDGECELWLDQSEEFGDLEHLEEELYTTYLVDADDHYFESR